MNKATCLSERIMNGLLSNQNGLSLTTNKLVISHNSSHLKTDTMTPCPLAPPHRQRSARAAAQRRDATGTKLCCVQPSTSVSNGESCGVDNNELNNYRH